MDSKQSGVMGGIFAIPWCCVIPSGFSLLGLAGTAMVRQVMEGLVPYLLLLSVLFLGRAHYLLYIRHQGNRVSQGITWTATALAITFWSTRF